MNIQNQSKQFAHYNFYPAKTKKFTSFQIFKFKTVSPKEKPFKLHNTIFSKTVVYSLLAQL